MRILLTGFTPFLDVDVNPTALIIEHMATQHYPGLEIIAEVLPTMYDTAGARIEALITEHTPDSVVCLGVAQGRSAINLECVARNRDSTTRPDNAGAIRDDTPIIPDGAETYLATLPLARFQAALTGQGIPVVYSDDAGAYVCNHVFYRARHALEQQGRAIPCGFIHVPGIGEEPPGLPLATMIAAVEMCLHEIAASLNDSQPAHTGKLNYDALAAQYARSRGIHPAVLNSLAMTGGVTSSSKVAEIGCGTGNYINGLVTHTDCAGWGIDPSNEMLAYARQQPTALHIQPGFAHETGLPPGLFDLVYSVDVIHHLDDTAAYFREAYRLLRPGGKICTVTDSEAIIRTRQPLSTHFPETIAPELARYPHIADLESSMSQVGFQGIEQQAAEDRTRLTDISAYREKVFSALHLIAEEDFQRGLAHLEAELQEKGAVVRVSRYVLLWGIKPVDQRPRIT
ncbi:MAG: methyltransferase domain-containing protein [Anaerolineaceae bacterium]|nr:methyltransferase domain-containing protein [Anaerolineaceae bacterium]